MKDGKLVGKIYEVDATDDGRCTDCEFQSEFGECADSKGSFGCAGNKILKVIPATDDIEKLLAETLDKISSYIGRLCDEKPSCGEKDRSFTCIDQSIGHDMEALAIKALAMYNQQRD